MLKPTSVWTHASKILPLVVIILAGSTYGQILPFQSYTIEQGLASDDVTSLFQDSKGYLWIGTGNGISIFDGTTFRSLSVSDGLALSNTTHITESHHTPGTMIIGTWGRGISRLRDGRFTTLLPDSSMRAKTIVAAEEDHHGTLWCLTYAGLYTSTTGGFTRFPYPEDVTAIMIAKDSLVWVAAGRTILLCSPGSGEERERIILPVTGRAMLLHQSLTGSVWVATSDSQLIQLVDRKQVAQHKIPFGSVRSIADDPDGRVWIGTNSGLLSIQKGGESFVRYSVDEGLKSNLVSACLVDDENNLWVGGVGLLRLIDRNICSFDVPGMPESYNNCKAVTDDRGHIWAATDHGLIEIWKDEAGYWRTHKSSVRVVSGESFTCVVRDNAGRLWIDTKGRIECYEIDPTSRGPSTLKLKKALEPGLHLPQGLRFFFIVDSRQNLWLSMLGQGVYKIQTWNRSTPMKHYSLSNGLPSNDIRAIYEDREGRMWFGSVAEGLVVVPEHGDSALSRYTTAEGLPDAMIRAVVQDKNALMWIGTRRRGLAILGNGMFRNVSVEHGLAGGAVWALAVDDESNLVWAGTSQGVQRIDHASLTPLRSNIALLGKAVTALGTYRGQFLWFTTKDVLTVYEYQAATVNTSSPRTYVTRFIVNAQNIDTRPSMEFNHDENHCTFEYIGITYREKEAVRYQYRLVGAENNWQTPTTQRTVTYASLSPGSYIFEVRTINADGVMSTTPARLSFSIAPPFWGTWWFRVLSSVTVLATLFLFYRRRVRGLEKEKRTQQEFSARLMESQENERKRIAGELHDSLGQNLLVIRNRALLGLKADALSEQARSQLDQISSVATQAIDEVRGIAYDLRPYQLDRLGLTKAITSITSGLATSVHFSMDVDPIDDEVGKDQAIHVYRIVQEGINNILKHADATEAHVAIRVEASNLRITISDNGKGMPQESTDGPDGKRGFGLVGITERAKVLNGSVAIESAPGKGTMLTVVIPRRRAGNSSH